MFIGNSGANLECLLSYPEIERDSIGNILEVFSSFKLRESNPISIYGEEDYFEPKNTLDSWDGIDQLLNNEYTLIVVKLYTDIGGKEVPLSLSVNLTNNVINISVPEGMIWEFDYTNKPSFNNLKSFGRICENVCDICAPKYAIIGTESYQEEDVVVNKLDADSSFNTYDKQCFSEKEMMELFNWYTNEYKAQ